MRAGDCECSAPAREPAAGVAGQQAPPVERHGPPSPGFDDPTGRARVLRRVADEARTVALLPWLRDAFYRPQPGDDLSGNAPGPDLRPGPSMFETPSATGPGNLPTDPGDFPVDPGDLPGPGDGPGDDPEPPRSRGLWKPKREFTCPVTLPGEYRADEATLQYDVHTAGAGGDGKVYAVGDSLLDRASRTALEGVLATYIAANAIPGAALAVVDDRGHLVHCTGLTNLTVHEQHRLTRCWAGPHSAFRLGSVSKTLTAWATCRLVDLGLVPDLQARLADYVDLERLPAPIARDEWSVFGPPEAVGVKGWDGKLDDRRDRITLEALLTHRGGWYDDGASFARGSAGVLRWDTNVYPYVLKRNLDSNPGYMDQVINSLLPEIAATNRATWPVTHDHMLRYFNLWKLAFAPGSHFAYSNLGYWMLGRVIEAASCRGYESLVRELLLQPLGMSRTRVGPDVSWERGVGDVPVYSRPWPSSGTEPSRAQSYQGTTGSFTATDLKDYAPYAERSLRAADASGGWVASVYDLGLFLRECFVRRALLTDRRWYGQMFQYQGPTGPSSGLGYGWDLTGGKGAYGVQKGGHLDGGAAYVYNQLNARGSRGLSLAMVYNRFPFTGNETNDRNAESTLRSNLRAALGAINLPAGPRDLFRELAR